MKAIPLKSKDGQMVQCEPSEATHVRLHLPGPTSQLTLPVIIKGTRAGTGWWTWNGDCEKPTLKPSVLLTSGHFAKEFDASKDTCWCKYNKEHPNETPVFHCFRCHTWINDGIAQFLDDCTHAFRGQSVELLEVELPVATA
ncbi:MAG TPA: hypothetical protein VH413_16235 [Verrucomicrobiae bacterium]|jgi:hypothetical protein|nr:hypothetical protein [Verrucomicrobiae bacterium]